MKKVKAFIIGFIALAVTVPAMAQDDAQSTIETVAAIIKSKPADLDDQLKPIYKKNKKNAEVLVGIGRVFFEEGDSLNADTYAGYAIKANKEYAPAFVLLGDIAAKGGDGGVAAQYYQQAIYFDPQDPDGYFKYASVYRKINPTEAVAKLEDLRAQRPDVAVDAFIGHIYYLSGDLENAIASFSKVDYAQMTERNVTEYAMSLYLSQKYAECLELAKSGLAKTPRGAAYNRLAFISCTELKDYDAALQYADALFNRSDSVKITYFDYTYYGNTYSGLEQYDKAIEMYNKALAEEIDSQDKRAGVIKQLSDAYQKMKDYENAIKYYQDYLATVSSASANDQVALAQLYLQYADSLSRDSIVMADTVNNKSIENYKKAEQVYIDLDQKNPQAHEYALLMRARVNVYMDPESNEGLAKPFYEELVSIIEPREERSSADNARLVESYRYLGGYYFLKQDDKESALVYFNKILEVSPNDAQALQVVELLK